MFIGGRDYILRSSLMWDFCILRIGVFDGVHDSVLSIKRGEGVRVEGGSEA